MSAAVTNAGPSTTPETPVPRAVRLVRVTALLVAGAAITFTATLHQLLGFDRGITSASLAAIGIAHLVEWIARRSGSPSPIPLLLGIASIVAAVVLPFAGTTIVLAAVIAAWGLVSALLEFLSSAVRPGSRQDATVVGAAGILLAILALLVRGDSVAILGFFGAYTIITGVFLGISAFDTRRPDSEPAPR